MIKSISIIGSGRWAKQYIFTLLKNKLTNKIILITKKNTLRIKSWLLNNNLQKKITIKDKILETNNNIAIVTNLASKHYESANLLIKKGYNVLIEKPICLNFLDAKKIYRDSKISNVYVACSNVLLFSSYINNFSKLIRKNNIKNINFIWHDKKGDIRYKEKVRADNKLSVCFDALTHIIPILSSFYKTNNKYNLKTIKKRVINNNAADVKFKLNDTECSCNLRKNAKKRLRVILANKNHINFKFDFSNENSIFIEKNGKLINRLNQKGKRPLHKMLNVFLKGVTTKNYDKRIDLKNNIQIIKFIEKILK